MNSTYLRPTCHADDRRSDPANHTDHRERQKSLNSMDLSSHNNVGFFIFKYIKVIKYLIILYLYFLLFYIFAVVILLSSKEDDYSASFFVTRVRVYPRQRNFMVATTSRLFPVLYLP